LVFLSFALPVAYLLSSSGLLRWELRRISVLLGKHDRAFVEWVQGKNLDIVEISMSGPYVAFNGEVLLVVRTDGVVQSFRAIMRDCEYPSVKWDILRVDMTLWDFDRASGWRCDPRWVCVDSFQTSSISIAHASSPSFVSARPFSVIFIVGDMFETSKYAAGVF
jgi:hypothetical protein